MYLLRTRWNHLFFSIVAMVLLASACTRAPSADEERGQSGGLSPEAPNVLVIVTDDQRAGESMKVMPRTRRLFKREGVRFPNAYVTTPLCCPSRATIMSGRYAHNHRVETLQHGPRLEMSTTLQAHLQRAGYLTGTVGKYLQGVNFEDDPPYFDRWAIAQNKPYYYDVPYNQDGAVVDLGDRYSTDYIAETGVDVLNDFNKRDDAQPWYLYLAVHAPHPPAQPKDEYKDAPVPPWKKTPALEAAGQKRPRFGTPAASKDLSTLRDDQLRTLISVDELVGAVFDELERLGEDNTLAIFLSDNGFLLGERGIYGKRVPYRESVRVPFLVRWPGNLEGGTTDRRLIANIDIAPTVLDVAGLREDAAEMDGKSLLSDGRHRALLLEHWEGDGEPVPDWASLITRRFQYTEYRPQNRAVVREYFDLRRDPWQLHDVLQDGDRRNDPDTDRLGRRLRMLRRCSASTCP
jgi:arylsulfatase A-like enzyme